MIRKFKISDLETIMQIWKNENIKAHHFISEKYWEENYEYVKSILPQAEIYIYESKGITGFAGLTGNYIAGIFIDSDSQRSGVGTALINEIKKHKNCLTLKVYEKNKPAVNFYLKNNFKIHNIGIDEATAEKEFTMIWEK